MSAALRLLSVFMLVCPLWTIRAAGADDGADLGKIESTWAGKLAVTGAFFEKPLGDVYADESEPKVKDAGDGRHVLSFPWGEVAVTYEAVEGIAAERRINVSVETVVRSGSDPLVGLHLQLGELAFPAEPKLRNRSFLFYTKGDAAHNIGQPGVMVAAWDGGKVTLCNEQFRRPLAFGFGPAGEDKKTRPVLVYTSRHPSTGERYPFIERPIHPGGRDVYELSIRFGGGDVAVNDMTADLYRRFGETYPHELEWPDRRPIGALFISRAHQSLEENWPKNPRGWLNAKDLDITTEEGRAEFKDRVMKWAGNVARIGKEMNAQGVVLWDPEGQEYPHMTSYLGDPRSIPEEMDAIIDEFFKTIRDAGLRTGVCIRPQRPMRPAYGPMVQQIGFKDPQARLANLSAKIEYAKERWGCTLFYMDSNVVYAGDPVKIPGVSGYSAYIDADVLRALTLKHPDVLIMPEWECLRTYAYTAPYDQLNYNKRVTPPEDVRLTYPDAFFVNRVDAKSAAEHREGLVSSVEQGNILYYSGWYGAKENDIVKAVYAEADKGASLSPGEETRKQTDAGSK